VYALRYWPVELVEYSIWLGSTLTTVPTEVGVKKVRDDFPIVATKMIVTTAMIANSFFLFV
jgi:hypothetical protein